MTLYDSTSWEKEFEVASLKGFVKEFKDEPRDWVRLRLENRPHDELADWFRRYLEESDLLQDLLEVRVSRDSRDEEAKQ